MVPQSQRVTTIHLMVLSKLVLVRSGLHYPLLIKWQAEGQEMSLRVTLTKPLRVSAPWGC
jgi:hypothetical protein